MILHYYLEEALVLEEAAVGLKEMKSMVVEKRNIFYQNSGENYTYKQGLESDCIRGFENLYM